MPVFSLPPQFLVYVTVLGFCLFLALLMYCFWKHGLYWERYFVKSSSSFEGLIVTRVVDEYELDSDLESEELDEAEEGRKTTRMRFQLPLWLQKD